MRVGARTNGDVYPNGTLGPGLEEILRTSSSLLASRGYHGTSIRDIAQATGRSLSGLYHYLRKKEDILFLINYQGFSALNESWRRLDEVFDDPYQRLYAFVFSHTRHFVDHLDEMRVMTWGTQELDLDEARTIQALKDRYTRTARGLIADVSRADSGRPLRGKRLSRETFILFGMMNWIFGWYEKSEHGRVADLVDDICSTFLNGVCRGRGVELGGVRSRVRRWFNDNKSSGMWETPTT
jgi:AcrR family transcriptional regulator